MLNKRRRYSGDTLTFLAFHNLAVDKTYLPEGIQRKDLACLAALKYIQNERNDIIQAKYIGPLLGENIRTCENRLKRLEIMGYTQNLPRWNVTVNGETLLRTYELQMSRCINDRPLSPWNKIKDGDPLEALYRGKK